MCLSIPLNPLRGSNKIQKFIEIAIEQSLKSDMQHRHGAVIVYRNKVVAFGYNRMIWNNRNCFYARHAEVDALKDFFIRKLDKRILKDCTMYVIRIGKASMDYPTKLSKPCKNCYNYIKKSGIKKVYFSTDYEIENSPGYDSDSSGSCTYKRDYNYDL